MEPYDERFELGLRLVDYMVHIVAQDSGVFIEVEEKTTGNIWNAMQSAGSVEGITAKTGHPKKFYVFCRMLRLSLQGKSESVTVDILNPQDILEMKRRSGAQVPETTFSPEQLRARRFLILTEVTEFDRVHYPIPMAFMEQVPPDRLIQTIDRLKSEVEMAKSQSQFRVTSSSAASSFHSNTEMYNRSGASFYTMPEAENEALIKENEDL